MLALALSVTASFEGDKVLIAAVLFVLTLLGAYIPWLLNARCCAPYFDDADGVPGSSPRAGPATALTSTSESRQRALRERVMNVLSCLAGGVILGAGFTHILPDAAEAFDEYYASRRSADDDDDDTYPMAFAVALGTLLFLWTVDRVWGHSGGHGHSHGGHSHGDGHGHAHARTSAYGAPNVVIVPAGSAAADAKQQNGSGLDYGGSGSNGNGNAVVAVASPTDGGASGNSSDVALDGRPLPGSGVAQGDDAGSVDPLDADADAIALARAEKKRHAYVLCAAMTFHAVCDGLALGTEEEEDRKFAAVLMAVGVHKWLDGMAVGVPVFAAFMQPLPNWAAIVPLCVFTSLMTPLGVFIGMSWGGEALSKALLLSISAGSFIFIPLIEMIPMGMEDGKRLPLKFAVVFLGAFLMALLAAWS